MKALSVMITAFMILLMSHAAFCDDKMTLTAPFDLRNRPYPNADHVASLKAGETLDFIAIEGDWYKVRTNAGQTGYVPTKVLSDPALKKAAQENLFNSQQPTMSDYAHRVLGTLIYIGWIALYGFAIFLTICLLLLPLFVWQIKKQAVKTNQLLEPLIQISNSK